MNCCIKDKVSIHDMHSKYFRYFIQVINCIIINLLTIPYNVIN